MNKAIPFRRVGMLRILAYFKSSARRRVRTPETLTGQIRRISKVVAEFADFFLLRLACSAGFKHCHVSAIRYVCSR
jgi:hypothetical protein